MPLAGSGDCRNRRPGRAAPLDRAGVPGGLRAYQNQPAGSARSSVLSAAWPTSDSGTAISSG